MKKRKILVLARYPVGGIRTWFRYIYAQSRFRDAHLTLLLPRHAEIAALRDDLGNNNVTFLVSRADPGAYAWTVNRIILMRNWDLVHSHGFGTAMFATPATLLRGIPHLVTQHDVIGKHQFRGLKGGLTLRMLSFVLMNATMIHSVGCAAARNLSEMVPNVKERTNRCVIRNGIDVDRFHSAAPMNLNEKFDIPDGRKVIGFFGRFMNQKGFRYLVEAIRILEFQFGDSTPVVLAVGGGGFRDREERNLRTDGLDRHFRFIDFTPDIAVLIKSVDMVVMPSLWEAYSILAMEAAAAGVPVILSDCPALLEVSSFFPARVCEAGNGESLALAVAREMENPKTEAASAWAKTMRQTFSATVTAEKIHELYAKLILGDR